MAAAAAATVRSLSLVLQGDSKKTAQSITSRSVVKNCPILIIFGRNIPEKIWLEVVI